MMSQKLFAAVKKLAETDPMDASVDALVEELRAEADLIGEKEKDAEAGSFSETSMKDDVESLGHQVEMLRAAAEVPARNYARIAAILGGLQHAVKAAQRPQNAAARPALAQAVRKVAGLFSQVESGQDLDQPLSEIEKAVRSLYK